MDTPDSSPAITSNLAYEEKHRLLWVDFFTLQMSVHGLRFGLCKDVLAVVSRVFKEVFMLIVAILV